MLGPGLKISPVGSGGAELAGEVAWPGLVGDRRKERGYVPFFEFMG
jgi:hypothetical protein